MATPIGHEFERERICESFDTRYADEIRRGFRAGSKRKGYAEAAGQYRRAESKRAQRSG